MNTHEAANIASSVLGEYLALLSKVEVHGGERVTNTIRKIEEAKRVLDSQYPPPLGISVSEYVRLLERFG